MSYDSTKQIAYMSGYKYQLVDDYFHVLSPDFDGVEPFDSGFLKFQPSIFLIRKGYAWDGPSGPAIDTKNLMRGSLVHDALYQAMRMKLIDISFKDTCDRELKRICLEDSMGVVRASMIYEAVKLFGYDSATKSKEVIIAP